MQLLLAPSKASRNAHWQRGRRLLCSLADLCGVGNPLVTLDAQLYSSFVCCVLVTPSIGVCTCRHSLALRPPDMPSQYARHSAGQARSPGDSMPSRFASSQHR